MEWNTTYVMRTYIRKIMVDLARYCWRTVAVTDKYMDMIWTQVCTSNRYRGACRYRYGYAYGRIKSWLKIHERSMTVLESIYRSDFV